MTLSVELVRNTIQTTFATVLWPTWWRISVIKTWIAVKHGFKSIASNYFLQSNSIKTSLWKDFLCRPTRQLNICQNVVFDEYISPYKVVFVEVLLFSQLN